MLANSEYEFTLFVSQKSYSSKPSKDEMPQMRFVPQQLTIESALECATQGKAFCYTFQSNKADGSLSVKDKKKENFISTSAIIYDFDDMEVSMADFINSLFNISHHSHILHTQTVRTDYRGSGLHTFSMLKYLVRVTSMPYITPLPMPITSLLRQRNRAVGMSEALLRCTSVPLRTYLPTSATQCIP